MLTCSYALYSILTHTHTAAGILFQCSTSFTIAQHSPSCDMMNVNLLWLHDQTHTLVYNITWLGT